MEELFASAFDDPPRVDEFAFALSPEHAELVEQRGGVAFLLEQLKQPSLLRRWNAVLALSFARTEREQVSAALCADLAHPHGLYRRQVRWALHRLAPHSTAALVAALADPARAAQALEALAFQGPAAASVKGVRDARLLEAVQGPWPVDPKEPIPYLGEHVRYFSEPATAEGAAAREEYEINLWCDGLSEFVKQVELDEDSLFSLEAWDAEVEARAKKSLDAWKPGQLVLARRSITLVFYDWETGKNAEAKIESEDPRGFTMGALLHQVQLVYDERAHANDRVFEGLKLEAPGRYTISTGS